MIENSLNLFHYFPLIHCHNFYPDLDAINAQTKRIVLHGVKNNQSFKSLVDMTKIVNMTPGASIEVPTSAYKIKKKVKSDLDIEFHIECKKCKIFSASENWNSFTKCVTCGNALKAKDSDHFVYIRIKQQLIKHVKDNLNHIVSQKSSSDKKDSIITDVHDSILYKNVESKYENINVLPLCVNTDGASVHESNNKSLWAIQCYQNYLAPNVRYKSENIMVVALFYGTKKPEMQHFFYRW